MRYRDILGQADAFFRRVARDQPAQLQCNGCSLCCFGLFEIAAADIAVLAEGLAQLHPARRKAVIRRALTIVESAAHPDLRAASASDREAFFGRTDSVACPNLSDDGRCVVYEHRPLVCRTFGLPLREGDRYIGDICELNFADATDDEKLAAAWDLNEEDAVGPEDQYTVPEAIIAIARMRGWL